MICTRSPAPKVRNQFSSAPKLHIEAIKWQTFRKTFKPSQTNTQNSKQVYFLPPPSHLPFPTHSIRAAQTELQSTIEARQKLESQHQENKGVAREFTSLSDKEGAGKIYKVVGPVLLAQDKSEAVMAVQARLEFIEKEMYVFFSFLFGLDDDDQRGLTLLLAFFPRPPPPLWL